MRTEKQIVSDNSQLYNRIVALLEQSRKTVKTAVNLSMVYTYFEIGRMIVENEQNGKERAEYGKETLKTLSVKLTEKFGKGFSADNLQNMRNFYRIYTTKQISEKVSRKSSRNAQSAPTKSLEKHATIDNNSTISCASQAEKVFTLSWSHYLFLMRISNPEERNFYEIEAHTNDWSLSELKRQFNSGLYERLALSKNKEEVIALSRQGQIVEKAADIVKDPYILEFLGLPELPRYSETDLENKIIDHLQTFLLELGKGFTFVERQARFTYDEEHFRVDLVFYNRLLRCFVLFDLKIGELKHQDIGQMQMYVNYYDRKVKLEDENPTIGILLCKDKKQSIVEMTLPLDNTQIFASKYMEVLPSKEMLQELLKDKEIMG
ncbi:MAG: PDDEXK nuclease domain-containing protein [Paludibacter sp.]|nr:PDDEXK nuclease domain-containing protein [Bacteroidales bacterium]MCM1069021.1 PDDEXK nuclease domain-containing protein [Prevotella sp.]MCM1353684.1 PDDEXK nuclease domain-containing protein [Bacteroides sp.]MCM1441967.1 PDDEXK nuclease domain-containing protein [Muribaculum sp.]MCM1481577.1 PDDEXK nuclease domain-containing protein [Paludibacter sp.]